MPAGAEWGAGEGGMVVVGSAAGGERHNRKAGRSENISVTGG